MQKKVTDPREKFPASGETGVIFPERPYRGYGGAALPHFKNTEDSESEFLPLPEKVVISMQQHIGAPCEPTVKAGDHVDIGQPVGESSAYVSAPVHASVSGKVVKIGDILLPSGQKAKSVEIEADGKQTIWEGCKAPKATNAKELCEAVRASGLVGLGGAGFPAHVKLNIPDGKTVDTLVINGAECEPYLTSDYREMVECSEDVLDGIYTIKKILGIKRVIIGIEDNKPEAIKLLSEIADNDELDPEDQVRVLRLKARYPQGAEKVLIRSCTGRAVPKGKLPVDVGCLVMNIGSVAFISRYLKDGVPLVNKRLTVDGSAIVEPKNVIAPIGAPLKDIIEFCGGYKAEPRKILMGGPMMGIAMFDETTPILKQNNGILVLAGESVDEHEPTDCIHCARCSDACPMRLQPMSIEHYVKTEDTDALDRLSVMSCMECGTCAYVCPAKRKLVQYMKLGKEKLRKAGDKK